MRQARSSDGSADRTKLGSTVRLAAAHGLHRHGPEDHGVRMRPATKRPRFRIARQASAAPVRDQQADPPGPSTTLDDRIPLISSAQREPPNHESERRRRRRRRSDAWHSSRPAAAGLTTAAGRYRERRATRSDRDRDARISRKHSCATERAGRGGDLSAAGWGSARASTREHASDRVGPGARMRSNRQTGAVLADALRVLARARRVSKF
jgi:hypothetical protein